MSHISLQKNPGYTTSDGQHHAKRADAIAHEVFLTRKARLEAAFDASVLDEETAEFIAKNGNQLLELLTVKLSPGGKRKAAATAEAPATTEAGEAAAEGAEATA